MTETLGIYIQVPFCASKCSFCNFSSRVGRPGEFDAYCDALAAEIDRLPHIYGQAGIKTRALLLPVDSIYIGGGTPSLFGAERLKRIVDALGRRFDLLGSLEFTLEVSPGSAAGDFLREVRALGANRLSIGAQSFNDLELRTVGRLHTAGETRELALQARRAGFQNINLDLVAGLPHQTDATWRQSLSTALDLRPQHLSVYLFEIDEKSRLGREVLNGGTRYGAATVPGEEFLGTAYELARGLLAQAGYVQYEVSNFAFPGCSSRHNRKYWRLEPYLGFGAGAHSFDGDQRWANEEIVEAYAAKLSRGESPISEVRNLSPKEQLEEFFFLGLRQNDGIDLALARDRWGRDQTAAPEARVAALVADGWVERVTDRVRLAERAFLVSNEIFEHFLT